MRYRTLGRTGLDVSTISMGCNRLGDPGTDPACWPPLVERALQLGVTFFDTSMSYNQGRSEAILGSVAASQPVHFSTKVGFNLDFDVGGEHARRRRGPPTGRAGPDPGIAPGVARRRPLVGTRVATVQHAPHADSR